MAKGLRVVITLPQPMYTALKGICVQTGYSMSFEMGNAVKLYLQEFSKNPPIPSQISSSAAAGPTGRKLGKNQLHIQQMEAMSDQELTEHLQELKVLAPVDKDSFAQIIETLPEHSAFGTAGERKTIWRRMIKTPEGKYIKDPSTDNGQSTGNLEMIFNKMRRTGKL